jgi:hypothetical protein
MTAPAPPLNSFVLLDRLIMEAFTDLRAARAVAARTGDRQNLDLLTRAEEHLNALLEYRHAVLRRCPRSQSAWRQSRAAVATGRGDPPT